MRTRDGVASACMVWATSRAVAASSAPACALCFHSVCQLFRIA